MRIEDIKSNTETFSGNLESHRVTNSNSSLGAKMERTLSKANMMQARAAFCGAKFRPNMTQIICNIVQQSNHNKIGNSYGEFA